VSPRARAPRRLIAGLKSQLQPFGLSESVALFFVDGGPLPREFAQDSLSRVARDLDLTYRPSGSGWSVPGLTRRP